MPMLSIAVFETNFLYLSILYLLVLTYINMLPHFCFFFNRDFEKHLKKEIKCSNIVYVYKFNSTAKPALMRIEDMGQGKYLEF